MYESPTRLNAVLRLVLAEYGVSQLLDNVNGLRKMCRASTPLDAEMLREARSIIESLKDGIGCSRESFESIG